MRALLMTFSLQELRQHPWRSAAAVLAVVLGVALALAVQLINASALDEFSSAVRAVNGQPDLELRAAGDGFDERAYGIAARHPAVQLASPVLEVQVLAQAAGRARTGLRIVGVDALLLPALAPDLMPRPAEGADRFALFAPRTLFLNAAAEQALGSGPVALQTGLARSDFAVAGRVAAGGGPLAVMDIGAAQDAFGRAGRLTRIDIRLAPGADPAALLRALQADPGWPPGIVAAQPGDAAERISNLSRAYRVNLTVLALVALFTGAFLVFSVLALSVAQRTPQFALLGVLGLAPRERLRLVLAESAVLGVAGSVLGIALGTALAAAALRLLGGDLGGGYFSEGGAPRLQWSAWTALGYGLLGTLAALVGGWWPARAAAALQPAQGLKGLATGGGATPRSAPGLLLLAVGGALAFAPPLFGMPLAAYVAIALLLVGGIVVLPWAIALAYDRLAPRIAHRLLPLLAVERARRMRHTAAVAVSGVVASLALSVALTVMVASFRQSVIAWLDVVLPADLYVRSALAGGSGNEATLPPRFVAAAAALPGVRLASAQRTSRLLLQPDQPAVAIVARDVDAADPARNLPLVGDTATPPPGTVPVYVSEAVVALYGVRPGQLWPALSEPFRSVASGGSAPPATFFIAGVWRDYVRQFGAVALARSDWQRLTGDAAVNDLSLVLAPGADARAVQAALRALADAEQAGAGELLQFGSAAEIRAVSLAIFDRSFAVTYWLQAVAIAIGLFGIAASFSAQVLARRKEFGLLAHLGLTRRQILAVVSGEGAAWTAIGAAAGCVLGLAVAVVLVKVVNPQSFRWTMELTVPGLRLALLCAAVVAAGTVTAWLAGRAAAGRDAVLAVKEDW